MSLRHYLAKKNQLKKIHMKMFVYERMCKHEILMQKIKDRMRIYTILSVWPLTQNYNNCHF